MDINLMNKAADNIRILAASMVEKAKSGHPGGAMGGADFINVLYSKYIVNDPSDPTLRPNLYAELMICCTLSTLDAKVAMIIRVFL